MEKKIIHDGWLMVIIFILMSGCVPPKECEFHFTPKEIIDPGTLVTEDLPEKVWGKAFMQQMGFEKNNEFDIRRWDFQAKEGTVSGSNAYYTLFNHGGPHIDAPNHVG